MTPRSPHQEVFDHQKMKKKTKTKTDNGYVPFGVCISKCQLHGHQQIKTSGDLGSRNIKTSKPCLLTPSNILAHPMSSMLMRIMLGESAKTQAGKRRMSRAIFISKTTHVYLESINRKQLTENIKHYSSKE